MSDAHAPSAQPPTGPPDGPGPEDSTPAKASWKQWAAAGAVAATIAIGGGLALNATSHKGGSAQAVATGAATTTPGSGTGQGPGTFRGGRGSSGTLTKVDGTVLTLESTDQSGAKTTITVKTTADTTFTESVEGSVSDLAKGDHVLVMGDTVDGVVAAQRVVDNGKLALRGPGAGGQPPAGRPDGAPPADQPPSDGSAVTTPDGSIPPGTPPAGGSFGNPGSFTNGTITAIDGDTITVAAADGTSVKVSITNDTTVTVTKSLTLADLATGDTLSAMGTTAGDVVTATSVRRGDLGRGGFGGPGGPPPGAAPGQVTSSSTTQGA